MWIESGDIVSNRKARCDAVPGRLYFFLTFFLRKSKRKKTPAATATVAGFHIGMMANIGEIRNQRATLPLK